MACTVAYYRQRDVDRAEQFLGRKLTAEEAWAKADVVTVGSAKAAERLVEHLRLTGCVARWEEGEPEGHFEGRRQ